MTTLTYAVFSLGGDLMALPTAGRSPQSIHQMVGGVNWYGVEASSSEAAIAQAHAEGFRPNIRTAQNYSLVTEESPAMSESFFSTIKKLSEDQPNETL